MIQQKIQEKNPKYGELKKKLQDYGAILVVVGTLGSVPERYLEKIGIKVRTEVMQKTALLGAGRTLKKVLET